MREERSRISIALRPSGSVSKSSNSPLVVHGWAKAAGVWGDHTGCRDKTSSDDKVSGIGWIGSQLGTAFQIGQCSVFFLLDVHVVGGGCWLCLPAQLWTVQSGPGVQKLAGLVFKGTFPHPAAADYCVCRPCIRHCELSHLTLANHLRTWEFQPISAVARGWTANIKLVS